MSGENRNPMSRAQAAARAVLPKRFYREVSTAPIETGYAVLLDGRPLRTPARHVFAVPNAPLAEAVAEEWRGQGETLDPETMPVTRIVNSALDGVTAAREAVAAEVVRFAGSDLLCYRTDGPEGLIANQIERWDPLVRWAKGVLGLDLVLAAGVMHVDQPEETLNRVSETVAGLDAIELAALHVMTTLTGSAVIALAVLRRQIGVGEAWAAAHVDEDWQISQWGEDAEAAARRARRWKEMEAAARIVALMRS